MPFWFAGLEQLLDGDVRHRLDHGERWRAELEQRPHHLLPSSGGPA